MPDKEDKKPPLLRRSQSFVNVFKKWEGSETVHKDSNKMDIRKPLLRRAVSQSQISTPKDVHVLRDKTDRREGTNVVTIQRPTPVLRKTKSESQLLSEVNEISISQSPSSERISNSKHKPKLRRAVIHNQLMVRTESANRQPCQLKKAKFHSEILRTQSESNLIGSPRYQEPLINPSKNFQTNAYFNHRFGKVQGLDQSSQIIEYPYWQNIRRTSSDPEGIGKEGIGTNWGYIQSVISSRQSWGSHSNVSELSDLQSIAEGEGYRYSTELEKVYHWIHKTHVEFRDLLQRVSKLREALVDLRIEKDVKNVTVPVDIKETDE